MLACCASGAQSDDEFRVLNNRSNRACFFRHERLQLQNVLVFEAYYKFIAVQARSLSVHSV